MNEFGRDSTPPVQASLELLGEGALPQALEVLSTHVATGEETDAAAWGLLSVLATDQAEADKCLEQVSRLLLVGHRQTEALQVEVTAARSKGDTRLEDAAKMQPAHPAVSPESLAEDRSSAHPESGRMRQDEGAAYIAAELSLRDPAFRIRHRQEDSFRTRNTHSTSSGIVNRLVRLAGAALSAVLVLAMLSVIALLVAPRVVGAHLLVVQSQSMEPVVPMGALAVSLPVSPSEIAVGDVITYQSLDLGGESGFVTHRVVERLGDGVGLRFVTKGDASEAADLDPVPPSAIVGRAALVIPLIGFLVVGMRTPLGFLVIIGIPALALLIGELREIVSILRSQHRNRRAAVP